MPGVDIDFEQYASGILLEDLKGQMLRAKDEIAKMENPHARVSIFLDQWVQDNFKTEGGNIPGGWEPFAFGGRLQDDLSVDPTAKLLQDTGRLRASFIPFATKKDAGIGSKVPYSKDHQEGNRFENLPEREMLPRADYPAGKRNPDKDVGERIQQVFKDHVIEIVEAEGWEIKRD